MNSYKKEEIWVESNSLVRLEATPPQTKRTWRPLFLRQRRNSPWNESSLQHLFPGKEHMEIPTLEAKEELLSGEGYKLDDSRKTEILLKETVKVVKKEIT